MTLAFPSSPPLVPSSAQGEAPAAPPRYIASGTASTTGPARTEDALIKLVNTPIGQWSLPRVKHPSALNGSMNGNTCVNNSRSLHDTWSLNSSLTITETSHGRGPASTFQAIGNAAGLTHRDFEDFASPRIDRQTGHRSIESDTESVKSEDSNDWWKYENLAYIPALEIWVNPDLIKTFGVEDNHKNLVHVPVLDKWVDPFSIPPHAIIDDSPHQTPGKNGEKILHTETSVRNKDPREASSQKTEGSIRKFIKSLFSTNKHQ